LSAPSGSAGIIFWAASKRLGRGPFWIEGLVLKRLQSIAIASLAGRAFAPQILAMPVTQVIVATCAGIGEFSHLKLLADGIVCARYEYEPDT
jgi:hypothetical protein